MPQVVGLFDDRDDAQDAVKDLLDKNFSNDRISIITGDPKGEFRRETVDTEGGTHAAEGALTGAVSGAVVGGIFGLLVGAGVLFFPALGLVAAGPVATTLAGAGIGAVGGGLIGVLIGLGIPEHQVSTYAEAIRRGSCLVSIEVNDADVQTANDIMKHNGAIDVHERAAYYAQQGFTKYDPSAQPYTHAQVEQERQNLNAYRSQMPPAPPAVATTYDQSQVRNRYNQAYSVQPQRLTYEQWEPAYRFGWNLAQNPQYQNFGQNEGMIRQQWEQANPGTYDLYRDAIQSGFDDAYARRTGPKMM